MKKNKIIVFVSMFILFLQNFSMNASAETNQIKNKSAQVQSKIAQKNTIAPSSSLKKPTGAVKSSMPQKTSSKQTPNSLTSSEKQMIDDFIKKAHAIPDTKSEKKDYKKFRTAVDAAYTAYEKMYHYENYISTHGMNVPDATNAQIKEAAKILFNAKHIENMVWRLKKDKNRKNSSTK